ADVQATLNVPKFNIATLSRGMKQPGLSRRGAAPNEAAEAAEGVAALLVRVSGSGTWAAFELAAASGAARYMERDGGVAAAAVD
ncbi:hypothetical protein MNEG_2432, partial [Monoraphidium neglectum]